MLVLGAITKINQPKKIQKVTNMDFFLILKALRILYNTSFKNIFQMFINPFSFFFVFWKAISFNIFNFSKI